MRQGDLIAFSTPGFYGNLIRFGERHFADVSAEAAEYSHIAYVDEVLPDGDAWLIQAVRTIDRVRLNAPREEGGYVGVPHRVLEWPGDDDGRQRMRPFAASCLGMDYGVLSVISRAINYLTPEWFRIDFTRSGRMDCSAFGARVWEHGGWVIPERKDPFQVAPANLVQWSLDAR